MRSKLCSFCLLFMVSIFGHAQPAIEWLEHTGRSYGSSVPTRMVNDAEGNVLTIGYFNDSIDMDPGPGTMMLYNEYGESDFFIQKLSSNGELIWAKDYGDTSQVVFLGIDTDNQNNIAICGYFTGTIEFDPTSPEVDSSVNLFPDIVLIKLDSDGNLIWHKTYGDNHMDRSFRLVFDSTGNIFIVGTFGSTLMDFDPGSGIDYLNNVGGGSNHDSFIQKFDPDGNHIWVRQLVSNDLMFTPVIDLDADENIVVAGHFGGTHDFDPGPAVVSLSSFAYNGFVLKLSPDGLFKWVIPIYSNDVEIRDLACDNSHHYFITGSFINSLSTYVGGSLVEDYGDPSSLDGFVIKIDTLGDTKWKRLITSTGNEIVQDIDIGPSNTIYISGNFNEALDFDEETDLWFISPFSSNDNFLLQLNSEGVTEWVQTVSGGSAPANRISTSNSGELYFTITFYDTIQSMPDSFQELITFSPTESNYATYKFNTYLSDEQIINSNSVTFLPELYVYPNPTGKVINIDLANFSGETLIKVFDQAGNLILTEVTDSKLWQSDLSLLPSGIYIIWIQNDFIIKTALISKL